MPRSSFWNGAAIGIVSVFLGVVAFAFSQSIFDLFFVPAVVAVLWGYASRVKRLEARLSQVEARLSSYQPGPAHENPNP
jgi:hypothetical protein